jgi:D-tyrosyl-tRNA(Tyr) deacylase
MFFIIENIEINFIGKISTNKVPKYLILIYKNRKIINKINKFYKKINKKYIDNKYIRSRYIIINIIKKKKLKYFNFF